MSTKDCISILQSCKGALQHDYGITSLRLFGSMARGEQREHSDVDIFVDTASPNPFALMDAKEYLEQCIGAPVDIVRNHQRMNPRLRQRIERDGVPVF